MGGLWTGIQPVHISVISKMVSDYSGMMVQPHKVRSSRQSLASRGASPATWRTHVTF